jgi:predicted ferric reductase
MEGVRTMNEKTWWYLSRSSGIVALILLVLSIVWGVLLATRALRHIDRPAWLLDLHRWLGGTALVMTGLHMLGLYLDSYIQFGLAELLVPWQSSYRPLAVAVGILSLYVMVAVQATSYMRRWLSKRVWHGIHLLSYGLVWGAAIHAGMAGTDTINRAYQGATMIRIVTPGRTRRATAS